MATIKRGRRPGTVDRIIAVSATRDDFERLAAVVRDDHAELARIGRALEIQFQRIVQLQQGLDEIRRAWAVASLPSQDRLAQLQADLDEIKRAWEKMKPSK